MLSKGWQAMHDATTNSRAAGNPKPDKKNGFFGDLSVAQVSAGALAAVTSMLLSSRIGIAGSVIGVAVGSIVSAVAGQVYKRFLEASADRIRTMGSSSVDATVQNPAMHERAHDGGTRNPQGNKMTDDFRSRSSFRSASSGEGEGLAGVHASRGASAHGSTDRYTRARQAKFASTGKMVIVVSVLAALVAVGISAFAIDKLTMGKGVGAKTPSVAALSHSMASDSAAQGETGQAGASASSSSEPVAETTSKDVKSNGKDAAEANSGASSENAGTSNSTSENAVNGGSADSTGESGSSSSSSASSSSSGSEPSQGTSNTSAGGSSQSNGATSSSSEGGASPSSSGVSGANDAA